MVGLIQHFGYRTVLDIGSGTGRGLQYLKRKLPDLQVIGVEPSAPLRQAGHRSGLTVDELVDGDATRLAMTDASIDLVCAFGVLHHIKHPQTALAEMLRVARHGVFLSDMNHFAIGSAVGQRVKRGLDRLGLWKAAYWVRTSGKGYRLSEGDGLSYAYSLFDDLAFLRARTASLQLASTRGDQANLYTGATHVALFGLKSAPSATRA